MAIEMGPTVKPIPDRNVYSTVELELFPRLTRESYKTMFGEQAPKFDYGQPIKRWFDTGVTGSTYRMLVLDKKKLELVEITISAVQAEMVNLPGIYEYPAWKPAPSKVRILFVKTGATTSGSPAENLATKEQADALVSEVAGAFGVSVSAVTVSENELGEDFQYLYPADDPRRVYRLLVDLGGGRLRTFLVGRLLQEKYRAGVGATGNWVRAGNDETANLTWISDIGPTLNWNDLPETPIPMRPLNADEELFYQAMGQVGVRKKTAVPAGGEGFTEADRAVLKSISDRLSLVFGS